MKKIILKFLYFLSFAPAVCIIGSSIYYYFEGFGGWPFAGADGFSAVLFLLFILFGIYWFITIPILTICLIYQIFYRKKVRKK